MASTQNSFFNSQKVNDTVLILGLIVMLCIPISFAIIIWKAPKEKPQTIEVQTEEYRTYALEGCEYVVFGCGQEQWGGHKGNCKNKIHTSK